MIPRRNTLIALDGETEIRTPLRRLPAGHAEPAAEPWPHRGRLARFMAA